MNKEIMNMDSSSQRKEQISKADRGPSYIQKYPSHLQDYGICIQKNPPFSSSIENSSQY